MPTGLHRFSLLSTVVVLLSATLCLSQSADQISGFVFDQNGSPISNASVEFTESSGSHARHITATDTEGQFLFESISDRRGTLTVFAPGFQRSTISLTETNVEIQLVLVPAAVSGTVTITRSEARLEETSASIVALGRRELDTTAAAMLDDKLRQVPGFSLFRRSGSRTAKSDNSGRIAPRCRSIGCEPYACSRRWYPAKRSIRRMDLLGTRPRRIDLASRSTTRAVGRSLRELGYRWGHIGANSDTGL